MSNNTEMNNTKMNSETNEKEVSKDLTIVDFADKNLPTANVNADMLDDFKSVEGVLQVAQHLIKSRLIPSSYKTPEAVLAGVQKGYEMGFKPMTSMDFIDVIAGRLTLNGKGIGAKIMNNPDCAYQIDKDENGPIDFRPIKNEEGTVIDYITTVRGYRKKEGLNMVMEEVASFTWSEATKMGYTNKDQWKKQPGVMLYWRAITKLARRMFPDLIAGLYSTDEMLDVQGKNYTMTEDGTVINIQ